MLRVGLTGGIACGKSTVAAMLRELGCAVLEADPLAHEELEPGGESFEEVRREFGPGILDPCGRVDRAKLAEIVFADPAKLARLNQIIHPRLIRKIEEWLEEEDRPGGPGVAVVAAALLIEAGYDRKFDRLVVVWCRPEQQRARLAGRGMTRAQIERRMAAQMSLEEKRRRADDTIDCSAPLEDTRRQVEQLVAQLERLAAARGNVRGRRGP